MTLPPPPPPPPSTMTTKLLFGFDHLSGNGPFPSLCLNRCSMLRGGGGLGVVVVWGGVRGEDWSLSELELKAGIITSATEWACPPRRGMTAVARGFRSAANRRRVSPNHVFHVFFVFFKNQHISFTADHSATQHGNAHCRCSALWGESVPDSNLL